jgi:hypothetical protein
VAVERRANTTSFVILILLAEVLPPSETGVGILFAEENEPLTY